MTTDTNAPIAIFVLVARDSNGDCETAVGRTEDQAWAKFLHEQREFWLEDAQCGLDNNDAEWATQSADTAALFADRETFAANCEDLGYFAHDIEIHSHVL